MLKIRHAGDLYKLISTYDHEHLLNNYHEGFWETMSSHYFTIYLRCMTLALRKMGLKKGDRVAILADPSPHWNVVDVATMMAGGVTVPFYATLSSTNFVFEAKQSKPKFVFVGDEKQWQLLAPHTELFEKVISLEKDGDPRANLTFDEVIAIGQQELRTHPEEFDRILSEIDPDDLATIIYTSGAGGQPKGAEMTHRGLLHLAQFPEFEWSTENDRYLNILPLAHIFGRQLNLIQIAWGVPIYYLNDLTKLMLVCREVRPTLMIVVPRVLERFYAKLEQALQKAGWFTRTLGLLALKIGRQKGGLFKKLFFPIADIFVYSSIRESWGNELRILFCGGAALDHSLNQFFLDMGFPLIEGWGLTEASTVCVNRVGHQKVGTVGPVLNDLKVATTETGQVKVFGATVMRGYYLMPEENAKVFDKEGWFYTGDKGSLDSNGFLTILGRVNEMFKTSGGEYVSPEPIEALLAEIPLVDRAMIIGEKRPFTVAMIFPDVTALRNLKKSLGKEVLSDREFVNTPELQEKMRSAIDQVNKQINSWESIRNWVFIFDPLSIEGGDLTPTLKFQRKHLLDKYRVEIDNAYKESSA